MRSLKAIQYSPKVNDAIAPWHTLIWSNFVCIATSRISFCLKGTRNSFVKNNFSDLFSYSLLRAHAYILRNFSCNDILVLFYCGICSFLVQLVTSIALATYQKIIQWNLGYLNPQFFDSPDSWNQKLFPLHLLRLDFYTSDYSNQIQGFCFV